MMKPEPSALERCCGRGAPGLAVHEVAEEVLERRAGRDHRAHAVVDVGDGGRGGDVDDRRAQPVGEVGEALRDAAGRERGLGAAGAAKRRERDRGERRARRASWRGMPR